MNKEKYLKALKALGMSNEEIRKLDKHQNELTKMIEAGEKDLNMPNIPTEIQKEITARISKYYQAGHRGKNLLDYYREVSMELAGLTEKQADFYVYVSRLLIMEMFLGLGNLKYVIDRKKKTEDYTA